MLVNKINTILSARCGRVKSETNSQITIPKQIRLRAKHFCGDCEKCPLLGPHASGPYSQSRVTHTHTHREIISFEMWSNRRKEGHNGGARELTYDECECHAGDTFPGMHHGGNWQSHQGYQWRKKGMHKGARSLSNDHQSNTNCTLPPACGFSLWEPVDPSPQSLNLPPHRRGKVTLLPDENHASKRCVQVFSFFVVVRSGN